MPASPRRRIYVELAWTAAAGLGVACASPGRRSPADVSPDGSLAASPEAGSFSALDAGSAAFVGGDSSAGEDAGAPFAGPLPGPFYDFPSSPVVDASDGGTPAAPTNAPQLFGPATQGAQSGGPCLVEPEVGALYPNNWLRPRFAWTTPNSEDLFELRVHADNQANDLVVYTTETQWTMPKTMWLALATHSQDVAMTVTLRGGLLEAGSLASEALGFERADRHRTRRRSWKHRVLGVVENAQTGILKGFAIGDETVGDVLTPAQVQERGAGGVPCIGCHASTPDGLNVGFSIGYAEGSPGAYTDSIATIGTSATPGFVPSFLTADAKAAMDSLGGIPAYSPAHWKTGDRIVLLSDVGDLRWLNLEATGAQVAGVVARGPADKELATDPTWSRDGTTIVYTSAQGVYNGRQNSGPMDLYSVPYSGGAGGAAAPIAGAPP